MVSADATLRHLEGFKSSRHAPFVMKPGSGNWLIDGRRIEVAPSIEGIRSIRTDRTGERNVGLHLDGARWLL